MRARAGGAAASHRGSGDRRHHARRPLPGAAWLPRCGCCPSPAEPGVAPAPVLARLRPSPGCGERAHALPAASDCGTLPFRGRPLRLVPLPPHPLPPTPSRPPRGGGGGGICRLIYHQSFAQAAIFKAVPTTSPAGERRRGRDGVEEATPGTRFLQSITLLASETEMLSIGKRRKTSRPAARPRALRRDSSTLLAGRCRGQGGTWGWGGGEVEVGWEPGLRHRRPG